MSVRWAASGDAVDVDLVALIVGEDRRVRSDADMIFYNQPRTRDGSVVHAGKVLGDGRGADDVSVDISSLPDDVAGLTIAASTDGAPLSEVDELRWCVVLENGDVAVTYQVEGLTTERVLVLCELDRRAGSWRLRAVGQGWEGGLAGLATDYGVSIDDADAAEPINELNEVEEFDVLENNPSIEIVSDSSVTEREVIGDCGSVQAPGAPEQVDPDFVSRNGRREERT